MRTYQSNSLTIKSRYPLRFYALAILFIAGMFSPLYSSNIVDFENIESGFVIFLFLFLFLLLGIFLNESMPKVKWVKLNKSRLKIKCITSDRFYVELIEIKKMRS